MSFINSSVEIHKEDLVLAWMTRSDIKPIRLVEGEALNTRYGAFPHDKIIGQKYGTQMASTSKNGFIHLLSPTPELWSLSLPHRTQIVYTPDASYIVQRLNIRPRSVVIEAGTGSGSFTHAIARTVGSNGKIYTYEFHEPRFHEAKKEIDDHGLASNVSITHRDVCNEGFEVENEKIEASAVFLDLPAPWTAIPHLTSVVTKKRTVSICCFSPCIEQVVQTVEALKKEGWSHIEMVEVSSKKWEGHKEMVREIDDALERLKDVKRRRIAGLERRNERIRQDKDGIEPKRALEQSEDSQKEDKDDTTQGKQGYNPWGQGLRIKEGDEKYKWIDVSRVEPEIKSHTSYLTFAILPPPLPKGLVDESGFVISKSV